MTKKFEVGPSHPPMTVAEIANLTGLSHSSVYKRLKHGLTGQALLAPAKNNNQEKVYDVGPNHPPMTITQISNFTGINRKTISGRILDHHLTGERLLEKTYTRTNTKISRNHRFDVGPNHPPMTIDEISNLTGLSRNTIDTRIRKYQMSGAKLLQPNLKRLRRYDVGHGQLLSPNEIARQAGISVAAVLQRLKQGKTGVDLLRPAKRPRLRHDVGPNYPALTIAEIAKIANVSVNVIEYRIKNGWRGTDLLKPSQKSRPSRHVSRQHS